MRFINLTPHAVVVAGREIPPSGKVARVVYARDDAAPLGDIPVAVLTVSELAELPPPQPETYYIVSALVAQLANRDDVVAPDTDRAQRDETGRIVSVPGLVQYS